MVSTIRKDSRGFVRARYAANFRRREVVGRADEKFDNCAEASSGMTGSAFPFSKPASFNRFLRRCGSSAEFVCVAMDSEVTVSGEPAGLAEVWLVG